MATVEARGRARASAPSSRSASSAVGETGQRIAERLPGELLLVQLAVRDVDVVHDGAAGGGTQRRHPHHEPALLVGAVHGIVEPEPLLCTREHRAQPGRGLRGAGCSSGRFFVRKREIARTDRSRPRVAVAHARGPIGVQREDRPFDVDDDRRALEGLEHRAGEELAFEDLVLCAHLVGDVARDALDGDHVALVVVDGDRAVFCPDPRAVLVAQAQP